MSITIPLIRGFALLPTLRWLAENGVPAEQALGEVDLSPNVMSEPFRPIPLVHAAALLRNAARKFGPDAPCRIVSGADSIEIAMLGKVALGTRTPGEALTRIVAALPYYCSHEQVSVERRPGKYIVREFFAHRFDPETQHTLLLYAASMVDRVLGMAGSPRPRFARIEIPPHPAFGVQHVGRWFGTDVIEKRSRGFMVVIDEKIMERPFSSIGRDRLNPRSLTDLVPLRGDGSLSGSVKSLLVSMLQSDQTPTMKRVVSAAGTSARTFQRQLEAEGTSFSGLLSDVRHRETLRRLNEHSDTIASIAADLGYSDQAAFTRAFRRWTGGPPGQFRGRGAKLAESV
jgi:AraC-like DNA-binding protein